MTQAECLRQYPMELMKYVVLAIFIAGLLFITQIVFYLKKYTDFKIIGIELITLTFLCFIYDTGTDLNSHGAYNRFILLVSMLICAFIFTLGKVLTDSLRRRPIISLMIIILCVFLIHYKINQIFTTSCVGWDDGLKGTKLINTPESQCKIYPPKTCYYEIFDGFFDVSKMLGETCENNGTNLFSNIEKYIPDKTSKIIGYPRTEKWIIFPDSTYGKMNKNVMSNMINMEDDKIDSKIKDNIEITTNFYKNPPEVNINLKRNEEIAKQRSETFNTKSKDKVMAKNVIHFFIDSLSRVNFKVKLPKFYKWIEKFYSKTNAPNPGMSRETFQFFKFHNVGRYTAINMIPTYFGVYNIYYDGKYFLKDYKDAGYVTGQAIDCCTREVFDIDGGAIERMQWTNYDHENISLFCDTNYVPYNEINSLLRGANSIKRRCLYNNNPSVYALEYMNQFFEKYKDEPKFFRVGLADGHDGTAEVIKYSDDILADFFEKFERDGHLDDTLLIISTDHGFSLPGPYSIPQLEDWDIETNLPTLFVIAPTNLKNFNEIRNNLKSNEQKMITPFNIYNSFKAILGDPKLRRSMIENNDIFTESLDEDRDCMNFYDLNYFDNPKNMLCRCSAL